MTLVGATLRFIKAPFVIEGLFQGVLAGTLALGLLALVYQLILRDGLQILLLAPTGFTIRFLPGEYQLAIGLAGALLGVLGSLLALRKFVRI
jgi:cell division transport system permease protein